MIYNKINKIIIRTTTALALMQFAFFSPLSMATGIANGAEAAQDTFTVSLSTTGVNSQPPTIPQNLAADIISSSEIDISWSASTGYLYPVSGYRIFRNAEFVATTTALIYSDQGLAANTIYTYTVQAFDTAINISSSSDPVSAKTLAAPVGPPGGGGIVLMISDISATPSLNGATVNFSINMPARGQIQWGLTSDAEMGSMQSISYGFDHEFHISGLEPGMTYYVKITVVNALGISVSQTITLRTLISTDLGPLPNPSNFKATAKLNHVLLTWHNPSDERFDGVRIVRSETFFPKDQFDGVPVYEGRRNSFMDKDVENGKTYYYAIFGKGKGGEFSSGALAQVRMPLPGEAVTPETGDPFLNIPESANVDPIIKGLTLSDFEFLQDGIIMNQINGTVAIDGGKNITIRLNYAKVPEVLKTVAITLHDPKDSSKVFPFLLRANDDKSYYEASLAPLGKSGRYAMSIVILDYQNQGLKRLSGTLAAMVFPAVGAQMADFDPLGFILLSIVVLFFFFILMKNRKRRETDGEEAAERRKYGRMATNACKISMIIFAVIAIGAPIGHAAFNKQINYQGKLTDATNMAVADGTYHMRFKLYTVQSGGSAIWEEDRSTALGDRVVITNGLFSVMLGSSTALTSVDFNQTLYLGVEIGGSAGAVDWDGEMSPRKILGAVPAAFESDKIDGLSSEQFLRSDTQNATSSASTFLNILQSGAGKIAEFFGQAGASVLSVLSSGNVGIGTTSPYARLSVVGQTVSEYFTATSTTATSTLPNLSLTRLLFGSDYLTDITGTGLTISNNALSVTGAVITGAANMLAAFDGLGNLTSTSTPTAARFIATSSVASVFPYASTTAITSSGSAYFATNGGNVGIGTTSPSEKFHLSNGTFLVDSPINPTLAGNYNTAGVANDVFVSGKYAYVADWNIPDTGLLIIDVSNPAFPTLVSTYNTPGFANGVFVSGKYAYVVDGTLSNNGLRIVDISNPSAPKMEGSLNLTVVNGRIYVSGKYAYLAGDDDLQIVDVSNPASPVLAGTFGAINQANVDTVYVNDQYAYVSEEDDIKIIDISNPSSPALVGSLNTGSTEILSIYVSGRYAYFSQGANLRIADISNPASPSIKGSVSAGDMVYDIKVSGKYAYVAAEEAGIKIIDISSSTAPFVVGSYDTADYAIRVQVVGKHAYVADYAAGLQIVDIKGADIYALQAGNVNAGTLTVWDNADIGNNLYVGNGLNVGIGGLYSQGGVFSYVSSSTSANPVSAAFMGGNVGIGTTSPYARLSVVGQTVSEYFTATSTTATSTLPNLSLTRLLFGSDYLTDITGTGLTISNNALSVTGAVITGAANMLAAFDSSGNLVSSSTPTAAAYLATSTTATSTFAGGLNVAGTSGLTVLQNGSVGIGTISPGVELDIGGAFVKNKSADETELRVTHATDDSIIRVGQGPNNHFFFAWDYNATAANAFGQFGTSLYANPIRIDGSVISMQSGGAGGVGINLLTPSYQLEVDGNARFTSLVDADHFIATSSSATSVFSGALTVTGKTTLGYASTTQIGSTGSAYFATGGGNVGIGTTTPNATLTLSNDTSAELAITENVDSTSAGQLTFRKQRGTGAVPAAAAVNDYSGFISFQARGTTGNMTEGASIYSQVEAIGGSSYSNLLFNTRDQTSTAITERMRIANNGNVGIGTTSPYARLSVVGQTVSEYFTATSTTATSTLPNLSLTRLLFGSDYLTDITGTGLTISNNALSVTGAVITGAANMLAAFDGLGNLVSSSTPTAAAYLATSTTATSTFAGGLDITGNGLQISSTGKLYQAGQVLSLSDTGNGNLTYGYQAGNAIDISLAQYNTAFGYQALKTATSSDYNTAVGYNALYSNTTGLANTANGYSTLYTNTTGYQNVADGMESLYSNTTGSNNTATGYRALYSNTSGILNTAGGYASLYSNTTGYNNTAFGVNAMYTNDSGYNNTSIGYQTLFSNVSGDNNTALGHNAGYSLTTGNYNIAMGYKVDLPSATGDQQLNIGNVLYGTGLYNGEDVSSTPTSDGKIGIGTTSPAAKLDVNGDMNVGTVVSYDPTGYSGNVLNVTGTALGAIQIGATTADADTTAYGDIDWMNFGTTASEKRLALIRGATQGTTANNRGGKLYFYTKQNNSSNFNEAMVIDNTGNVGIGNAAPNYNFQVTESGNSFMVEPNQSAVGEIPEGIYFGSADNNITLTAGGQGTAGKKVVGSYYNGSSWLSALEFANVASGYGTLALMKSGGNVGIGTTSPSRVLSVQGNSYVSGTSFFGGAITATSTLTVTGTTTSGVLSLGSNATVLDPTIGSHSGTIALNDSTVNNYGIGLGSLDGAKYPMWFQTGAVNGGGFEWYIGTSEKMRIDQSGNVGIGTTSPTSKLSLAGGSTISAATSDGADNSYLEISGGGTAAITRGAYIDLFGNEQAGLGDMRLIAGLGDASAGAGQIKFYTGAGPTQQMVITNSGNVGIGTTSPWGKLSVDVGTDAAAGIVLGKVSDADRSARLFFVDSTNSHAIYNSAGSLLFTYGAIPGSMSGTNAMVINNIGNVGVGASSPNTNLHVRGANDTGNVGLRLTNASTNALASTSIFFGVTTNEAFNGGEIRAIRSPSNDLQIYNNGNFTATFNGSNNVGIGTTTPNATLTLSNDTSAELAITENVDSTSAGQLTFRKQRGTGAVPAAAAVNDYSGFISFQARGTTGNMTEGASIYSQVEAIGGSSYSNLLFNTRDQTSTAITERMRIANNGNVGIGSTTPTSALTISSYTGMSAPSLTAGAPALLSLDDFGGNTALAFTINNLDTTASIQHRHNYINGLAYNLALNPLGGNVGIGTTNPGQKLQVDGGGVAFPAIANGAGTSYVCMTLATGVLSTSTSACNSSSARFKDNIKDLSYGIENIMKMNPVSFTYKSDMLVPGNQVGFLAEDMAKIIPEAVGYDAEGRPSNIDYGKLTPVLVKAVQEQEQKINILLASSTESFIASSTVPDWGSEIAEISARIDDLAATTENISAISSSSAQYLPDNTASALLASTSFIGKIAQAVQEVIQSAGHWVVDRFTAKIAYINRVEADVVSVSNGFEMIDRTTNAVWCVQIKSGDWSKIPGKCTDAVVVPPPSEVIDVSTTTPPTSPLPPEIGTTTPPTSPVTATSTPSVPDITATTTPSDTIVNATSTDTTASTSTSPVTTTTTESTSVIIPEETNTSGTPDTSIPASMGSAPSDTSAETSSDIQSTAASSPASVESSPASASSESSSVSSSPASSAVTSSSGESAPASTETGNN